jgi:hypothetical protein
MEKMCTHGLRRYAVVAGTLFRHHFFDGLYEAPWSIPSLPGMSTEYLVVTTIRDTHATTIE